MCGLTGYISYRKDEGFDVLDRMVSSMRHRGPDDKGHLFHDTAEYQVALGHARLSIMDLSELGHQPMERDHWAIVLNGEIYNFKEIRKELEPLGYRFESESDTEVVLAAYAQWGKACVHHFIGMFAFAILDRKKGELLLCRDRTGIKPLFYHQTDDNFLFGSELKALMAHPKFSKDIDHRSLALFMQFGYVPGPASIFENTWKLEPGNWLVMNLETRKSFTEKYWDPINFYRKPLLDISYDEAKRETEKLLQSACQYRMISDVPVGIFLSGGYDSTLVTSILQKDSTRRLKTFTIGFPDGQDESPDSERIASALGTDHTSYPCTFEEARAIIPDLPLFFDEPNADISCIPTMLVSKMARKEVTVALSADGGDEVFAGYNGYRTYQERFANLNRWPIALQLAAGLGLQVSAKLIAKSDARNKHRLEGLSEVLRAPASKKMQVLIEKTLQIPRSYFENLLATPIIPRHPVFEKNLSDLNDPSAVPLLVDYYSSLCDLLLVKVDRASMSVSLEGREPLLDHRLLEWSAQLPPQYKLQQGVQKRILKDIVHKYVDKNLMDRPKTGFDLPIYNWLNKELAYLIEENLNERDIKTSGVFQFEEVKNIICQFKENKLVYKPILWRLIVFQQWYKQWISN